jgi:hypothetical protein
MYRVVTKYQQIEGDRLQNTVVKGPWHPDEAAAKKWVRYLEKTGIYDKVFVESSKDVIGAGGANSSFQMVV